MAADETELSIENHWDHGTLWTKTLLYVEIALERDRESWLYPFWSALALELLARTAPSCAKTRPFEIAHKSAA